MLNWGRLKTGVGQRLLHITEEQCHVQRMRKNQDFVWLWTLWTAHSVELCPSLFFRYWKLVMYSWRETCFRSFSSEVCRKIFREYWIIFVSDRNWETAIKSHIHCTIQETVSVGGCVHTTKIEISMPTLTLLGLTPRPGTHSISQTWWKSAALFPD